MKTFLGRVVRDIERKITTPDTELQHLLELGKRLLTQKRTDKQKLYSIHEPQIECISKGKAHKNLSSEQKWVW